MNSKVKAVTGPLFLGLSLAISTAAGSVTVVSAQDAAPTSAPTASAAIFSQWAVNATASSEYDTASWSAAEAVGAPNIDACGDNSLAWASKTKTGIDSLTLTFAVPVVPTQVNIHETFNPGSITGIELIPADGSKAIVVAQSSDSGFKTCPGLFSVNLSAVKAIVSGVIIHVDQTKIASWDEIDAVQLVGQPPNGQINQFASKASATSQYGVSDWSAAQATNAPDVMTCSDNKKAWASASSNGVDTLTVAFTTPLSPLQINIYETYNPGSITSIDLIPADGSKPIPVPNSADKGTACPGVFSVKTVANTLISGVAIHLDQTKSVSWDEIDAVEMIGLPTASVASGGAAPQPATAATAAATLSGTAAVSP